MTKMNLVFSGPMLNVVIEEIKKNNCPLLFVKDCGVYIMSETGVCNGKGMRNVCYAHNFHPELDTFEDLWVRMHETCGGDDFCETLHLDKTTIDLLGTGLFAISIFLSDTEIILKLIAK